MRINIKLFRKLGVLVLILISGCQGEERNPASMVFGFESYSSINNVRNIIESRKLSWKEIERSGLSEKDTRPGFEIVRASTQGLSKKLSGKYVFTFFNDQLMSIWLYPKNKETANEYLKAQYRRTPVAGESIHLNSQITLRLGTDIHGSYYIAWEDEGLVAKHDKWISKYS